MTPSPRSASPLLSPPRAASSSISAAQTARKAALLLQAHTDTLGGMVAEIKANGRLRLVNLGGMRAENGETENVRVYTRSGKVVEGTLQLCNASIHVNGQYGETSPHL